MPRKPPKLERIPLAGSREERELRLRWLSLLLQLSSDIRAWAAEFQDIHAPPPPQTNNEAGGGLSEQKNRTVESSDGTLPIGATGMGRSWRARLRS
jgi:hypothetical protein